eukprot:5148293-Amphidinium_carterae.1
MPAVKRANNGEVQQEKRAKVSPSEYKVKEFDNELVKGVLNMSECPLSSFVHESTNDEIKHMVDNSARWHNNGKPDTIAGHYLCVNPMFRSIQETRKEPIPSSRKGFPEGVLDWVFRTLGR